MYFKVIFIFWIAIFSICESSYVRADDHDLVRLMNTDRYGGEHGLQRLIKDYQRIKKARVVQTTPKAVRSEPAAAIKNTKELKASEKSSDDGNPEKSSVTVLLRQNFSDIWLFAKPTAVAAAKGAEISWSRDNVAKDASWSVHGMTAVAYSLSGDYAENGSIGMLGFTLAAYAKLDRDTHSNLPKRNIDTLTGGLSSEVGIDAFGSSHYFRTSVAAVTDHIANQTAVTTIFEWIPVSEKLCVGYPCGLLGLPIIYRFQPELKVQYDRLPDPLQNLAFSNRNASLRIGPEFTLLFQPFGPPVAFLSQFHGKVTYHPWIETYSHKQQSWLDTSITYDIDKKGYLGLTGSYRRGNTEETGVLTDIYKIALTGKF